MAALIETLIDKFDNLELVRDKIAALLLEESDGQKTLAIAAAKDPLLWAMRVFTERSNPIAEWQEAPDDADPADLVPIVNVYFEAAQADAAASDTVYQQQVIATYNIDCYGYGFAKTDGATGHILGDAQAAFEAQRTARLVRNILMSAHYVCLGMRGVVGSRWIRSITEFQPAIDGRSMQQVVGVRIQFEVRMNEFSPQHVPTPLQILGVTVFRAETGEIYLKGDYPHDS
jgi:hypothetical protein